MLHLASLVPAVTAARWRAAADARTGGSLRLLDVLDPAEVLEATAALLPRLGPLWLCNLGQCWLRRAEPPHHWHQDGALHHDFIAAATGELLPMLTCWIALTDCGATAPGLQWTEPAPARLLHPAELTDAAVQASGAERRHALLKAGDALLFDGALLHRTQPLTPAMTQRRTSLELRFFASPPPARVAHEPLVDVRLRPLIQR